MSAQPLEIRMARLEGAYEQIGHRLGELRQDMDQRFADLRHDMDQRFSAVDRRLEALHQRLDQRFMWLAALVVSTWITTILTVLFHR